MNAALPAFGAAVRFQLGAFRRDPGTLLMLATAPFSAVILLSVTQHSGRPDLAPYALLAPAIMTAMGMAVMEAGETIFRDRAAGVLEALLTTPASLAVVLLGRISAITAVSLVGIAESWLVGALGFGVVVTVAHPLVFAATLLATAFGIAATGVLMASVFVMGRDVRSFQNSVTFPLYLLGGAMVPVTLLPAGLEALSRALFLSWATDLLRDSLAPAPVDAFGWRLAAVLGLGAATAAAGFGVMRALVRRVRHNGTVGFA
ncbi:ABC transporter permease [Glycomyces sp. TRM65418]|uniref:ABC transporter permease n=1 Tax=Glycomyces sp. TRM65418 TaxID=2867006 RepID=UPI001CE55B8C|nr:ABC transporter permease [Glycomyces sp. TRM65418]MCC3765345.1 ABC transporter permease [Glycomyces sp. TRM65418]QZD54962.1 ABC transporter permease [Glycomyces sp. TRM65418]